LDNRCVRVTETVYEFGQLVKGTPKSRASIHTVALPELIVPELISPPTPHRRPITRTISLKS